MNELLVFAKAPRVGLVKTRLAKDLGEAGALEAYRRLLGVVAGKVGGMQNGTVCFTPVGSEEELRPFFPGHWRFRPQEGVDLGERLVNALAASFGSGAERVAVIGADCPYLTSADIEAAWSGLDGNDLVLGPAQDGGYWLVAIKELHREIFTEISWGTGLVVEETLARAQELGLRVGLLRKLEDVDTIAEWKAFVKSDAFVSE